MSGGVDFKDKNYALIDLLHEMSLFINGEMVESFERAWILEANSKDWGIDSSLVSKNIDINNSTLSVVDMMEEIKWEKANMFQEEEMKHILDLFSIHRGNTKKDKILLENDNQSMKDFLIEINNYEGRFAMFEQWYKRKEKEIKNRGLLVVRSLIKPDNELYKVFRNKWEKKYKGFCSKVFDKEYDMITSEELNTFIENFIRR